MKITFMAIILGGFSLFLMSGSHADDWQRVDRYQVKGGLVKDPDTGLMWMRCSIGQEWDGETCSGSAQVYTWEQAMEIPQQHRYAGYSDWRLPSHEELKTLVYCSSGQTKPNDDGGIDCDGNYAQPTIVNTAFPATGVVEAYWSSSPLANNDIVAWYVSFNYGRDLWGNKKFDQHVRLVRIGQSIGLLDHKKENAKMVKQREASEQENFDELNKRLKSLRDGVAQSNRQAAQEAREAENTCQNLYVGKAIRLEVHYTVFGHTYSPTVSGVITGIGKNVASAKIVDSERYNGQVVETSCSDFN